MLNGYTNQFEFGGYRLIEIPVPTLQVQARVHPRRKRRLQKKWLKRYGLKTVVDPRADFDKVMVNDARREIYCYPEQAEAFRQEVAARISANIPSNRILTAPVGIPMPIINPKAY